MAVDCLALILSTTPHMCMESSCYARYSHEQIKRNKVSLGSKEEGRRDSWNIWEMEALRPDDWLSISHSVMSDSLRPFVTHQAPLSSGKNTGVGCHFLFQEIFLIWGSNLGLLHCRQILYRLSHPGKPDDGLNRVIHERQECGALPMRMTVSCYTIYSS